MPSAKMFNTLFLDRDGVLNKKIDHGYALEFDQIEILPGVPEFLGTARDYFDWIIVVTNQRCIGRGLISLEGVVKINDEINKLTGSFIDRFYICPHLEDDHCDCRKPKEGMFMQAQNEFDIDFGNSWMVGDSESDMIPAKKLGITTFLLSAHTSVFADKNIGSLWELKTFLEMSNT